MKNEDRVLARYPENMREALRLIASVVLRLHAGKAGLRPPFSPTVPRISGMENGNSAKKELL
jgi:hypothetical protein